MNPVLSKTSALAAVGALLEYPDSSFQQRYDDAFASLEEVDRDAVTAIKSFLAELGGMSTEYAQELYTRSFDLSPVCVPYASVHLFGAESFKRAELMTGLKTVYERVGFDCGGELPDHIAVLLQCAPRFDEEEWSELVTLVLLPALEKMIPALEHSGSPWRHALCAARMVMTLGDDTDGD